MITIIILKNEGALLLTTSIKWNDREIINIFLTTNKRGKNKTRRSKTQLNRTKMLIIIFIYINHIILLLQKIKCNFKFKLLYWLDQNTLIWTLGYEAKPLQSFFEKTNKTIQGIGHKRIWYYESDDFTTLYFA